MVGKINTSTHQELSLNALYDNLMFCVKMDSSLGLLGICDYDDVEITASLGHPS